MEKMLTFEEWSAMWDRGIFMRSAMESGSNVIRDLFDAARIGMISESEAVRLPPVNEWPEWATYIAVGFCDFEIGLPITSLPEPFTRHKWRRIPVTIPRPAPAWTPKVGDAVFALDGLTPNGIWVARVVAPPTSGKVFVVCNDGDENTWRIDRLKPFNAAYIGKPWDEIPGGPQ